jgi:hypothetical protein
VQRRLKLFVPLHAALRRRGTDQRHDQRETPTGSSKRHRHTLQDEP